MCNEEKPIRIHKLLSEQGICSRRDAEKMIREKLVEVNGKIAEIGQKVRASKDHILLQGEPLVIQLRKNTTLAFNKPRGVICSNYDPYHNQTVFDLLPNILRKERLFCAGRLDKESAGLLILTNDGTLANHLTHPSSLIIKRYEVKLNRSFKPTIIPLLKRGLDIDGEHLCVEKVIFLKKDKNQYTRLEIHLNHGRKREIRRLFEAFNYQVKKLIRRQIGGLTLQGIKTGCYRLLNSADIKKLTSTRK